MSAQTHLDNKNRLLLSALSVTACFVPVHGYRFFHLLASGDSLLQLYQDDAAWEIALGRFAQPFVVMFRGGLTTPFLIHLLACFWLVLAVFLTGLFLDLQKKVSVFLLAAFFVINRTVIMLSLSYLPWADSYMLSLLLAVFGVWLASEKRPWRIICGALCFAVSLGLYQAYICVALGLCAIRLILDLAQRTEKKETGNRVFAWAVSLALSAALYLAAWKGLQGALHIWTSDGYNGLSELNGVTDLVNAPVLSVVYGNVLRFFLDPVQIRVMTFRGMDLGTIWTVLFRIANLCVFALIVYHLVRLNRQNKTAGAVRLLQALLFVLMPLCVNFVCLASGGMQHVLMMFAFQLYYVLAIVLRERDAAPIYKADAEPVEAGAADNRCTRFMPVLLPLLAFIILWPQVIYANQISLKKSLQEEAAQSLMVRVLQTVEQTDGYEPGVTKVAFSGRLENNPYIAEKDLLTDEMPWGNMKTAFTYGGIEKTWLQYFEHTTMQILDSVPEEADVDAMPAFPVKGSVIFAGDVLVVKLSE